MLKLSICFRLSKKAKELQIGEDYLSALKDAKQFFTKDEIDTYYKEIELAEEMFRKYGSVNVSNEQLEQAFIDAGLEPEKE